MREKVSIITVCYNAEKELQTTIESVRNQTYKNIDYVIVDGASKDGTLDVIKQNSDVVSRWVSEKDGGLYYAMNKGLDLACGDYVLFLNAGDMFFEDTTLEKMLACSATAQDIYYGDTMILSQAGEPLGRRRLALPKRLSEKSFRWGMTVCHQSILIRKDLCSYYDTNYRITADYDWVLSAIERADKEKICNTGLFVSKFLQGGISSKNIKKANMERFVIMRKHYGLIPTVWYNVLMLFRLAYTYLKLGRI